MSRLLAARLLAAAGLLAIASAQLPTIAPGGVARFFADSIIVTRGGVPGGALAATTAYSVVACEYSPTGQLLQTVNIVAGASRCASPFAAGYAAEHFAQVCGGGGRGQFSRPFPPCT